MDLFHPVKIPDLKTALFLNNNLPYQNRIFLAKNKAFPSSLLYVPSSMGKIVLRKSQCTVKYKHVKHTGQNMFFSFDQ